MRGSWQRKGLWHMRHDTADVTYEELAERLKKHGMTETKASITNKLARGAFTATFFLAALTEIGCEVIRLEEV